MNYFSSDFKLGILGGGQLGKMLLFDTRKFDIQTYVLDPSDEAPSKIACNHFFQGDLMDYQTVYDFGKKVDVLTFEIELVNLEALTQLENEGVKVYPSPKTLKGIQNKGVQKQFYSDHNIPTAPFKRFENLENLQSAVTSSAVEIPFVWKCTEFGYDGNGVKVIRQNVLPKRWFRLKTNWQSLSAETRLAKLKRIRLSKWNFTRRPIRLNT
jgi:5-(carboxyamino)imidazole ribonucleotide synthase